MPALMEMHCRDLPAGTPPIAPDLKAELAREVPRWRVESGKLVRELAFADFKAALAFVAAVGKVAEAEGHHPDLHVTRYKHLRIELSTHSVGGLSENDFILAAKVERLPGVPA